MADAPTHSPYVLGACGHRANVGGGQRQVWLAFLGLRARGHRSALVVHPDSELRRRASEGTDTYPLAPRTGMDLRAAWRAVAADASGATRYRACPRPTGRGHDGPGPLAWQHGPSNPLRRGSSGRLAPRAERLLTMAASSGAVLRLHVGIHQVGAGSRRRTCRSHRDHP